MSRKETENSTTQNAPIDNFSAAVEALKAGDVIVYPTETLYGLGADALDDAALERVFQLKGRDSENPIPVLVADEEMLRGIAGEIPLAARTLIQRYWPGPLTLVLPARKGIPRPLQNSRGGVGVRISSQPIATRLVKALGRPVTATSANPSGKEPARTIQEAMSYFAKNVRTFLDGGPLRSKNGSTVVEVTGDSLKIIREGEISASELEQALKLTIEARRP